MQNRDFFEAPGWGHQECRMRGKDWGLVGALEEQWCPAAGTTLSCWPKSQRGWDWVPDHHLSHWADWLTVAAGHGL